MRHLLSSLLLASALSVSLPALAQEQAPPIQQQMSAEEFRAAGLDKLSADELARLNQWLNRRIDTVASEAAAQATEGLRSRARGFLNFGENETIEATLDGEFRGFSQGRVYRLDNGQEWEQIDGASLAGVRLSNPKVVIRSGLLGAWYMRVGSYGTNAKVRRIK